MPHIWPLKKKKKMEGREEEKKKEIKGRTFLSITEKNENILNHMIQG